MFKKKKSETLEKLPTECITLPYKTDTDVLKLNKVSQVSVLSFSIYLVMRCFVFYLKDRFPGQQMCSQTKNTTTSLFSYLQKCVHHSSRSCTLSYRVLSFMPSSDQSPLVVITLPLHRTRCETDL